MHIIKHNIFYVVGHIFSHTTPWLSKARWFSWVPSPELLADFIQFFTDTFFSWGRSFTLYFWLIHAKPSWTSLRAFPGKKGRNNPFLSSLVHIPLLILHLNLASWTWAITVDSNWPQMLFLTITALQINCPQLEKGRQASLSNLSPCNHFAIANNILLE